MKKISLSELESKTNTKIESWLPWKSNGMTYGYDANNKKICTGSQMGRRNLIPSERCDLPKLCLRRVPFSGGDYDTGGAYWGAPANLWCAFSTAAFGDSLHQIQIFTRAGSRAEARTKITTLLPEAKFFR